MLKRFWFVGGLLAASLTMGAIPNAEGQGFPGVTDTEIRIGNVIPYTGPLAAYGDLGRVYAAYFEMINDGGGINGRSVRLISYDDSYQPARSLERTRQLIERDNVLLVFQSLGLPAVAVREYLNEQRVPQLFAALALTAFEDPETYPWSMRWQPSLESEAIAVTTHLNERFVNGTVGLLYQADDFGAELIELFTELLPDHFELIAQPYSVSDPSVDAQIHALQAAGADIFLNMATPRAAAQAIRRAAEINWRPYQILISISSSIKNVIEPAGMENAMGIVSIRYLKDLSDPSVADDFDVVDFYEFWATYSPGPGDPGNPEAYAFAVASALVEVLKRCGDDLSRDNVLRQATSLTDLELPMLLPGITVNTGPLDYAPIEQFQLSRFDGAAFVNFGPLIDTSRE